jgi:hypothetical protein
MRSRELKARSKRLSIGVDIRKYSQQHAFLRDQPYRPAPGRS